MHSFRATSNLLNKAESILMCSLPSSIWIYSSEAMAFAKTKALPSLTIRASSSETKFLVSGSFGAI